MFKLSKKYCTICGKEVDKSKNIKRFGKHFCSDDHAEEFVTEQRKIENLENQMQAQKTQAPKQKSGCGCG